MSDEIEEKVASRSIKDRCEAEVARCHDIAEAFRYQAARYDEWVDYLHSQMPVCYCGDDSNREFEHYYDGHPCSEWMVL